MDDMHELLNYSKWNRRLMNLYWICNIIILIVEIAICIAFFNDILSESRNVESVTLNEYVFNYIFKPSGLTLLFTVTGEVLILLLQKRHPKCLPYITSGTCVAFCMVLITVHYGVNVIYISCTLPIMFSLVYNDKRVLWYTFLMSLLVFAATYGYMRVDTDMGQRFDFAELITSFAILLISYLICRTILSRLGEIVNKLVKTESTAYESKMAREYAEALAETRTRFLANMSHEIRTPMNGIIGLAELALEEQDYSAKGRDYLLKVKKSAIGLLGIVNDILDISKIDAGEIKLVKAPFRLHAVLDECETLVAYDAVRKGLRLYLYNEVENDCCIIGDATRLRQVLLNFLSNAIKFTNKGSITLIAKTNKIAPEGDKIWIHFEISDTGIGIDDRSQKEIFDPFKQADDSITRRFGGTGLGLAITKSIIEMMGGKISVASIPNVGSRFSFLLEFELREEMPPEEALDEVKIERPIFAGDVLVCEDNRIGRQVVRENLEKLGLRVVVAENGQECIDKIKECEQESRPFDIIFMDIHMPVMDGMQAAKVIKEMQVKTPIIAMTANVMPGDREEYLSVGMAECLYKPFRAPELWGCLHRYLIPVGTTTSIEKRPEERDDTPVNEAEGLENNIGDAKIYRRSLDIFVEEQPKILETFKKAIGEEDFTLANSIVHTAKNDAKLIGAGRLAELLTILEESLRWDASYFKSEMVDQYKEELNKVMTYIAKMN